MIRSGVNENNELVNSETKSADADIGFAKPFGGTEIPPGYLYCDGSEVSRQAYDKLFAAIGTIWGDGDGAETFNIPDLRGIFIRGDGGENNAAMGVKQDDAIREISGKFYALSSYDYANRFNEGVFDKINVTLTAGLAGDTGNTVGGGTYPFKASNVVPTAGENRPVNMAMKYCIRYE